MLIQNQTITHNGFLSLVSLSLRYSGLFVLNKIQFSEFGVGNQLFLFEEICMPAERDN